MTVPITTPVQQAPLLVGAGLSTALVVAVAVSEGSAKAALAGLGIALGVALFHSRFGFTSAWRQLVAVGQGRGLQAHMLMLAVALVGFSVVIENGKGFFGVTTGGYVAPITLGLLVGSFLFGI